jgi:MFS family permease
VLFFALTIPVSALLADRIGARITLILATVALIAFGFAFAPLFGTGTRAGTLGFLIIGMCVTGLTYGPLGSALAELFPTAIRYTGTSLSFNFAGILGASAAPYVATSLARNHGLAFVGYYLSAAGLVTLAALLLLRTDGRPSAAAPPPPNRPQPPNREWGHRPV